MVREAAEGSLVGVDLEEVQSMVEKLEEFEHAVKWSAGNLKILKPHFGIRMAARLWAVSS